MLRRNAACIKVASGSRYLRSRAQSYLWILSISACFLTWQLISVLGLVPPDRFPSLQNAFFTLLVLGKSPSFLLLVLRSFLNIVLGVVLALAVAIPTALLTSSRNRLDSAVTPLVMLVGALPDLALLPLLVMWFGAGSLAAIMMAGLTAFFPIYFTIREGVRNIPKEFFQVATVFGASRTDILTKTVLPAILPSTVTGVRLAFDFVWEIILAIEMIASVSGVGFFISQRITEDMGPAGINEAFAAVIAVGLIVILVDRGFFNLIERRFTRWRD